jgi:hypothetical protein
MNQMLLTNEDQVLSLRRQNETLVNELDDLRSGQHERCILYF